MRILLILSLSLFLGSCVSQRACDKKFPPAERVKDSIIIKDSVHIIEKVHHSLKIKDSIVYTKAIKDSGEVDAKENQTIKFKNDKVNLVIKIKDGVVKYNVDISPMESRYQSTIDSMSNELQSYKSRDSSNIHDSEKTKPTVVIKEPWYKRLWESVKNFFAYIGLIVVVIFLGRMALKFFIKV